jgi:hypothetical protein
VFIAIDRRFDLTSIEMIIHLKSRQINGNSSRTIMVVLELLPNSVTCYALKKILFRYRNQSVNHLVIKVQKDRTIG